MLLKSPQDKESSIPQMPPIPQMPSIPQMPRLGNPGLGCAVSDSKTMGIFQISTFPRL